jgi:hypothetical protein
VHLDSHADCCVFSEHGKVLNTDISRTVNLSPFKSHLGTIDAYDDPLTFATYILIFPESLQVPGMNHHIICPNQLRDNGIRVNETPLMYIPVEERNDISHSIVTDLLTIPLSMDGIHSSFNTRTPTDYKLENPNLFQHIYMTSDRFWEPHDNSFRDNDCALRSSIGSEQYHNDINRNISETSMQLASVSPALDDDNFVHLLNVSTILTSKFLNLSLHVVKHGVLSPLELSKRWFIGLNSAKRTLERTTQRGVRDYSTFKGTRRLRHLTYQLMYRHLRSSVYTDTMFSSVKSLQGNSCAQIYATWFQWVTAYPIPSKGDAHFTLDRLHREYGIFHTIIPDNAKELTQGEFKRKALKAGSYIALIEAYSHNQNLAESDMREIRRMFRKAMRQTHAPYVLWDFCIELVAKICSHTALDILLLQGDTPHTFLTGDTSDISNLCEFRWYDLIWYIDHLDDVGQAMASRILTSKAQILSPMSVFPLTIEDAKIASPLKNRLKSLT